MKRLSKGLIIVLAVALVLTLWSAPVASANELWIQRHNTTANYEVLNDDSVMFASGTDGTTNNDMAFFKADQKFKIKQNGFYMRFTYQEFDDDGETVTMQEWDKTYLRLVFCTSMELGPNGSDSILTVRLTPYYDSNDQRVEIAANYWGSNGTAAFDIDGWFFGHPYGGLFFNDGETENTLLIQYGKGPGGGDSKDLLWCCINDIWYNVEGVDQWQGAQGQAHQYNGSEWVAYPGMSELLTALDGANDGEGSYFGFWYNHNAGNSNPAEIKITAMGSPAAPAVNDHEETIVILKDSEASLELTTLFTQPNNDSMTFTANVGDITDGVWTYTSEQTQEVDVTFTATSNNANLGAYFSPRSNSTTITFVFVNALSAKDVSSLTRSVRTGNEVTVEDLSNYFEKGYAEDTLTFTANKGSIEGETFTYTPNTAGEVEIIITADDGRSTTEISFIITVIDNVKALSASGLSRKIKVNETVEIEDISQYFTKGQESDVLTFSANKGTIEGTTWSYTPASAGTETITITASDGEEEAQITFTIEAAEEGCSGCGALIPDQIIGLTIIIIAAIGVILARRKNSL